EGDLRPIGRPGGIRLLVERAGRQRLGLLRGDVEQVQVIAGAAQVAGDVLLEVIAIDDDGRRRLLLVRRLLVIVLGIARIRVFDDEDQTLRIRRPGIGRDPALDVADLDRLPAGARFISHNCPPLAPWREDTNDRYLLSGLQRGCDSPSGEEVTWIS